MRVLDDRFAGLQEFRYEPHYGELEVDGTRLRMHYLDEGEGRRGTVLMTHGMPTWSYLYRRMVSPLVAAGFRCVAPDHIGFGRSDKVLDDAWYTIERHSDALGQLVRGLNLRDLTLVCQDWGGPIGLRQVVDMPERFLRLAILNTWLHHEGFHYTEAIRRWQSLWQVGGPMAEINGCGLIMQNFVQRFGRGSAEPLTAEEAFRAYEAPFPDRESKAGPRRFPLLIPIDGQNPDVAREGQRCWDRILQWGKPVHFVWGTADDVFTEEWGRDWAAQYPQATFDTVPAGHFLQETHGAEVAELLLRRIDAE